MESTDSRLPTLPSSLSSFVGDDMSNDDISDGGSDFFPDWSSVDSCTSSLCSLGGMGPPRLAPPAKENIYLNGENFLAMQENEMEMVVENDEQVFSGVANENSSLRGRS